MRQLHILLKILIWMSVTAILVSTAATPREILVASYVPVANCSLEDPLNPSLFTGIEIMIVRDALNRVNWVEGTDFYFNCTTWDDLMDVIQNQRRLVLGSACGLTISLDRLQSGVKFSLPTMSTGISVLYRKTDKTTFYIRTFSPEFLASLVLLPILVGIIMYVLENRRVPWVNYMYHALTMYFKVDDMFFLTQESRITGLSAKIFTLVVMTVYVAVTVNIFDNDRNYGGVRQKSDLAGLKVATIEFYENNMRDVGAIFQSFPDLWEPADIQAELVSKDIIYFAQDGPIVSYLVATQCDLYEILNEVIKYDFGFMMPGNVDPNDQELLNYGITQTFAYKTQAEWTQEYFSTNMTGICTDKQTLGLSYVTIFDMRGLWYLWAVALGIGFLFWIFHELTKCCRNKRGYYHFTGIRSLADQEIQEHMTILCASRSAVSVAALNALKKSLYELYGNIQKKMGLHPRVVAGLVDVIDHCQDRSDRLNNAVDIARELNMNPLLRPVRDADVTDLQSDINVALQIAEKHHRKMKQGRLRRWCLKKLFGFRTMKQRKAGRKTSDIRDFMANMSNSDSRSQQRMLIRAQLMRSIGLTPDKLDEKILEFNREIVKIYHLKAYRIDKWAVETALELLQQKELDIKMDLKNNFDLHMEEFLPPKKVRQRLKPEYWGTDDGSEKELISSYLGTQEPLADGNTQIFSPVMRGRYKSSMFSRQRDSLPTPRIFYTPEPQLVPRSLSPLKNAVNHSMNPKSNRNVLHSRNNSTATNY